MNQTHIEKRKKAIKTKFGTIGRFIHLAGLEKKPVMSWMAGRMSQTLVDDFTRVLDTAIKQIDPHPDPRKITQEQRDFIRLQILIHWKTISNFTQQHPEFSHTFISNVITGRRKTADQRLNDLVLVIQKQTKRQTKKPAKS
jgi:uncharacterized protein YeaC (DUF1315 family)